MYRTKNQIPSPSQDFSMPNMMTKLVKLALLPLLIAFCSNSSFSIADDSVETHTKTETTAAEQATPTNSETPAATPISSYTIILETNEGNIVVELDNIKAPISVANFLQYVEEGFFEGVIFHRVIPGFMIQTGGFDTEMHKKRTHATIKNEAANGLTNLRGTLSMARTGAIDSATSQFFINLSDNNYLNNGERNYGYAVFGKVVEGMDVVSKIGTTKTVRRGAMKNLPAEPIIIKMAKVIKETLVSSAPKAPSNIQIN